MWLDVCGGRSGEALADKGLAMSNISHTERNPCLHRLFVPDCESWMTLSRFCVIPSFSNQRVAVLVVRPRLCLKQNIIASSCQSAIKPRQQGSCIAKTIQTHDKLPNPAQTGTNMPQTNQITSEQSPAHQKGSKRFQTRLNMSKQAETGPNRPKQASTRPNKAKHIQNNPGKSK